ncbi:MAG: type I polyketide synthase [Cyanomargarita calcarea GSE-NOS-MK-12-04C]|uniref:Type I polyketide synthase n=1 Tax=Cyanomargarita calcarea GSE-NOS-MK-12-04C TaxID=2839659 RepID=A0A951QKV2_9CYAN|nr:type I polyketide synthase [Cyanomargarita calcarea GSE-NOS-MK-12-04C]
MSNIPERLNQLSSSQQLLLTLTKARARLEAVELSKTEPIAIIGMGCRFPGGVSSCENFWKLLRDGVDAITEIPSERWNIDTHYAPNPNTPGKMYTRFGGFLQQVDQFDNNFFGISPREAISLDPQQRLLLEVAWEALENGGVAADRLSGSNTGIFLGIGQNDYAQLQLNCGEPTRINAYDGTGNGFCFASGRLSYTLGLQGPNVAIDTACSSSLVAVHLACQSLRLGECDLALAGGVHLILSPEVTIFLSQALALSSDGRCKTFDAAADGYGRGEGCGVLVLKRLSDAVENRDNILALIRGSAVNHDGLSSGLTVPNGFAQQALIRQALKSAQEKPERISYVETHGTGTSLGDPIEVRALAAVLGEGRSPKEPLIIGSVKTNIGHLEAAAGVAGLIKVVLALQHQEIPPHLHFKQPNPHLNWDKLPVVVPTKHQPWHSQQRSRLAGVSSFGISGTNAHLILEEAGEESQNQEAVERPLHIFTLSAKTEEALRQLVCRYKNHLTANLDLAIGNICFTANTGRSHFHHRLSLIASSTAELNEKLAALIEVPTGQVHSTSQLRVVFLFAGKNSQYIGMGRELYNTQPTFRTALNRCEQILQCYLEQPLLEVLYHEPSKSSLLNETAYTQAALFAVEYALAQLWQSWGIKPAAVIGYGVGEYVAACVCGIFSLEDGLKLITEGDRSKQITYSEPRINIVSNITGQPLSSSPEYWCSPIRDNQLTASLEQQSYEIFIECGPDPLKEKASVCLPSLRQGESDWQQMLHSLGLLYVRGVPIDWSGFDRDYLYRRLQLPTYPFQTQRYWIEEVENDPQKASTLSEDLIQTPIVKLLHQGNTQELAQLLTKAGNFSEDKIKLIPELLEILVKQHQEQVTLASIKDWLYQLQWELQPRQLKTTSDTWSNQQPGIWLILADSSGVGQALAELFQSQGHSCFLAYPKQADQSSVTKKNWVFNPADPNEFERLFLEIRANSKLPLQGIVHLWSLDTAQPNQLTISALEQAQVLGCGSVLHLVQMLLRQNIPVLPQLWLVTRGAMPINSILPGVAQAPLWGFGKTLSLEHPELWGGMIDLDPESAQDAATLFTEIIDSQGEVSLGFRAGQRYVARLVQSQTSEIPKVSLHSNATYLITGGLGSLGIKLAQWMVEQGARHLVLTGRNPASTQVQELIASMKQTGAKVETAQADIANEADMVKVLEEVKISMPPLQGIINAAGVFGYQPIKDMDLQALMSVLYPKVLGTWILHQLTQNIKLDFFVSFSSIASVWGSKGQAHYAAANHFLDILAYYRQSLGFPALTMNWGPWAGGGMASSPTAQEWLTRMGVKLLPGQAITALGIILQSCPQIVVANIDWTVFKKFYELRKQNPLLKKIETTSQEVLHKKQESTIRPQLQAALESEREALLITYLQTKVAKILGLQLSQLPATQQGFFYMGMDSLMAVSLKEEIEVDLGMPLPTTLIFEFPTIKDLAGHLLGEILPIKPSATDDVQLQSKKEFELSAMYQELSEDEIANLLANKLASLG